MYIYLEQKPNEFLFFCMLYFSAGIFGLLRRKSTWFKNLYGITVVVMLIPLGKMVLVNISFIKQSFSVNKN